MTLPVPPPYAAEPTATQDDSSRLPAAFRAVWVPAIVGLVVLELLTAPILERPVLLALVGLTIILGGTVVALLGSVGRRWTVPVVVAIAVLADASAVTTALVSSAGNDTAVLAPLLGGLLLASVLEGRRLLWCLGVQWAIGIVAAAIAFGLSDLRYVPNADPFVVSVGSSAVMTLIAYSMLWWVRYRLSAAVAAAGAAAAEARAAAESVRTMIASSPLPAIEFGPDGSLRYVNPAAVELLMLDPSPGAEADAATARIARPWIDRALRGETEPGERCVTMLPDGRELLLELHAARERSGDRVAGLICQLVDVTEREAGAAQRATADRLEAVGRMAGGVAHDFNNMLTAVVGHADLLLADLPPASAAAVEAAAIRDAGERGADLVRRLLAFARRQRLEPVLADANTLVTSLVPMLSRLVGGEVSLVIDLAATPLPVLADRGGIEQVLVNLVLNARDAMPDGGTLSITTRLVAQSGGRGDQAGAEGSVVIEVADSGVGMDEATLARLFVPFFTTKPGRGTGLGLTTARSIVEDSRGTITVSSRPGQGTTFQVALPLARDSAPSAVTAPAAAPRAMAPVPPTDGPRILVVDDEPAVRTVAARMLAQQGYRVEIAGDAAGAKAAVERGPFDLLLTDMLMPDVRGPALASVLQALAPGLAVAYMSGFDDVGDTLPPGRLLAKPFDAAQLGSFVARALAPTGAAAGTASSGASGVAAAPEG